MKPGERLTFDQPAALIDQVQYRADHNGHLDCCLNDGALTDRFKECAYKCHKDAMLFMSGEHERIHAPGD